ncbi:MAG: drug resistance transporter, EmrB/QacA subfamily protein [Frankiales bacterium]|nr:drug resistance transporter, EmrB/QacA subfamily protein [Frankiales bacterium]
MTVHTESTSGSPAKVPIGAHPPDGGPGSAGHSPGRRHVHPAVILAVLSSASFLAQLDVWITNVGLPAIGSGVGARSLSDLSWVLNGYAIVYAALLVPAGRLADRFGRKAGFLLGLAIFAVASVGAGLSSDIWVLVGFRALQALGAAVLTPSALGLVLTTAPADKVSQYVKIWFTSGALSATAGPVLGGLLVEASWRWLFLVNVPVVVIAAVLAVRLVPNTRHEQDVRFPDLLGGLILILGVGAFALGLVEAPSWGWSSARFIVAMALAALGVIGFLTRSARHPVPVIDLTLFRDRIFSAANLGAVLAFASFSIMLLSAILWMQGHWHYSAIRTGLGSAPGPVMFALFAAVADMLQQRFRVRASVIAAVGFIIAAVGSVMFAVLVHSDPNYVSGILPCWLILGTGFGLAVPTTISAATLDLKPAQAATGSAIVSMALQLGAVIGISILVAILGVASSGAGLHVFRVGWVVAAGLAAASVLAALAISPRRVQR